MMAAKMSGKTQDEIADDFNVSRSTVARVLNSDESKRLTDQARGNLISMATEACDTLLHAMQERDKNMGVAVNAATTILKGIGALSEKVQVTVLKPFIMKLIDGGEIHMGHKPEEEE